MSRGRGAVQTLSRCPSVPVQRYTSCHKHCCLHINPKHDFGTDEAGVLNFSNSFPLNQQKAVGLLYSVSCGFTVCAVCYIGLCGYNISIKTWTEVKLWQSIHQPLCFSARQSMTSCKWSCKPLAVKTLSLLHFTRNVYPVGNRRKNIKHWTNAERWAIPQMCTEHKRWSQIDTKACEKKNLYNMIHSQRTNAAVGIQCNTHIEGGSVSPSWLSWI